MQVVVAQTFLPHLAQRQLVTSTVVGHRHADEDEQKKKPATTNSFVRLLCCFTCMKYNTTSDICECDHHRDNDVPRPKIDERYAQRGKGRADQDGHLVT